MKILSIFILVSFNPGYISQIMVSFFYFRPKIPFLGKFGSKIQNCLFKLKFRTYTNSYVLNLMMMFDFSVLIKNVCLISHKDIINTLFLKVNNELHKINHWFISNKLPPRNSNILTLTQSSHSCSCSHSVYSFFHKRSKKDGIPL